MEASLLMQCIIIEKKSKRQVIMFNRMAHLFRRMCLNLIMGIAEAQI